MDIILLIFFKMKINKGIYEKILNKIYKLIIEYKKILFELIKIIYSLFS